MFAQSQTNQTIKRRPGAPLEAKNKYNNNQIQTNIAAFVICVCCLFLQFVVCCVVLLFVCCVLCVCLFVLCLCVFVVVVVDMLCVCSSDVGC